MHSRWFGSPPRWNSKEIRSGKRAGRLAASRTSRGGTLRPKPRYAGNRQTRRPSRMRRIHSCATPKASRTTPSRSSWRGAASSGRGSRQRRQPHNPSPTKNSDEHVMVNYIGTATPRVDGRAKVTGEAKYAAEFNTSGLAYGSIIESTIPKGRIARIDTSEALRVVGVLDVLTHGNRPPMATRDHDWKDDVAPEEGSPFRPLYDDKIRFSGQPIALVLAEEWEIARYAASLVRIEYEKQLFVTDLYKQRDQAFVVKKPEKPRGNVKNAYAAADVRHEAEYFIPTEHHNTMELFAYTVMWDGGGQLTVYYKTQSVR